MRTLIITPIPLIPTNEGNRVRIHAMIRVLQDLGHDIWILGLGLSVLDASAMKEVWGNRLSNAPRLTTSAIRPRWSSAWRPLLAIPEALRVDLSTD